ncbi:hypothetical protein CDAR_605971 [Caerostris darwini]|uniref:Uncharacterized protein n=1 Tax=Caerostris darwini TaxID=1538125 RepID=A0AAV4T277_9ARAC|nr:hypothetical protein CDAR_605971 [Caerostris darwini]
MKGTNSDCYIILRVVAITLLISNIMGSPQVDWVVLSRDTPLTENVIRSLKDNLDWSTLSSIFMIENKHLMDWRKISEFQLRSARYDIDFETSSTQPHSYREIF